jgi:hypothetical protein
MFHDGFQELGHNRFSSTYLINDSGSKIQRFHRIKIIIKIIKGLGTFTFSIRGLQKARLFATNMAFE